MNCSPPNFLSGSIKCKNLASISNDTLLFWRIGLPFENVFNFYSDARHDKFFDDY